MEIKEIEAVLTEALGKPEDDALQAKYTDAISGYLKDHKSSDEGERGCRVRTESSIRLGNSYC